MFEAGLIAAARKAAVMACIAAMPGGLFLKQAMAFPRNPERPMNATTCEEAMARLREAERGSPLVSAQTNREILAKARKIAIRLCGGKLLGEGD